MYRHDGLNQTLGLGLSVRDDLQSSSGRGRRQKSIVEIPTVAWRDPTQTRPSAPTTQSSPAADVEEALRPQSG